MTEAQQQQQQQAGAELDARVARVIGWPVIDAVQEESGRWGHPHKEDEVWFYRTPSNFPHVLRYSPEAVKENGWDWGDDEAGELHLYVGHFDEPGVWSPSTDMNCAMEAAEAVGLFERYYLWRYKKELLISDLATGICLTKSETAALAVALAVVAVAEKGQGEKP